MNTIREQIANNLLAITSNVKLTKPAGKPQLPLIVYDERSNVSINLAYSRHRYRITAYASTFTELCELVDNIEEMIGHELGLERVSKSPDESARVSNDMYMCRLEYTCMFNLIYNYIVRATKY